MIGSWGACTAVKTWGGLEFPASPNRQPTTPLTRLRRCGQETHHAAAAEQDHRLGALFRQHLRGHLDTSPSNHEDAGVGCWGELGT